MAKKLSKEELIKRCNKKHNNKYDYSLIVYKILKDKVKIICPIHGIFEQQLYSHMTTSGCPKCNNLTLNNDKFIKKAKEIHKDKYDYSLVDYKNALTSVIIKCKLHGIFEKTPDNHLYGKQGCPFCSNKKVTTKIFIKQVKEIHGNKYDYSLVKYNNSLEKVKIICKKHGIFEQTPSNHLRKKGCPKCVGRNRTTEEFIKLSKNIHGDKYNYELVEYKKSKNKVKIICKKHNKAFTQTPQDHLQGNGCPYCKTLTTEEFINKAKITHGDKYDYSLTNYINSRTKVEIICKKHNKIFKQLPQSHASGIGCPRCNTSKGENKIENILSNKNIIYVRQKKFDGCKNKYKLPFDFYLPDLNICIEYDGKQHFEAIEYWGGEEQFELIKIRDKIKTDFCIKNNIELLRINYRENIEEKLNKTLMYFNYI